MNAGLSAAFSLWAEEVADARAKERIEAEAAGRASELQFVKAEHSKILRSAQQMGEQQELEKKALQDALDTTRARADAEAKRRTEICKRAVERMLRGGTLSRPLMRWKQEVQGRKRLSHVTLVAVMRWRRRSLAQALESWTARHQWMRGMVTSGQRIMRRWKNRTGDVH